MATYNQYEWSCSFSPCRLSPRGVSLVAGEEEGRRARAIAVTGLASGIGAEFAALLTAGGHQVIGFDVVETDRKVAQFMKLDLSDPAAIDAAARSVEGPLDELCNNAGLPPRGGLDWMSSHMLEIEPPFPLTCS